MSLTVLIVEDELVTAKDLERKLKKTGYTSVGVAISGEAALEIFKDKSPDVVLMDIGLKSKLNGITTAEIMRTLRGNEFALIYISSYTDKVTKEAVIKTNPDSYITKPFDDGITRTINRIVFEQRGLELSIFLVDDDQFVHRTIMGMISRSEELIPFSPIIHSFFNGKEAFDSYDKIKPDIIVLDNMMPVMSGEDLIEALGTDRDCEIIFVTAYGSEKKVINVTQKGVRFFITKPFKMGSLISAIKEIAEGLLPK